MSVTFASLIASGTLTAHWHSVTLLKITHWRGVGLGMPYSCIEMYCKPTHFRYSLIFTNGPIRQIKTVVKICFYTFHYLVNKPSCPYLLLFGKQF
jgi:hypothetical protein